MMKLYKETRQHGVASAVLGAIGMLAWLIPLFGLITSVPAIMLGVYAFDNDKDNFAIAGLALGILSLILTIIRSGLVYLNG